MRNRIPAALAAILIAAVAGPATAADVNPKPASSWDAPVIPAATVNWTGIYIAAGIAMEAQSIDVPVGVGIAVDTDSTAIVGRIGYRRQTGPFVVGVSGGIQASNLEYVHGVDAEVAYDAAGEFGLALGGVLISAEGGYRWLPVDGSGTTSGDFDVDGAFVGGKVIVDLSAGWGASVGVRKYFLEADAAGQSVDVDSVEGMILLEKRLRF